MSITLHRDDDSPIAEVIINVPPVNALTVQGWFDLADAVTRAGKDPGTRVVILRAEGRGFCAGVDIKEMQATPGFGVLIGANRGCYTAFGAVYACEVPVIAAVHGFCLGGGIGLAGNADIVIASQDATFGLPEVDRGALVIPSVGARRHAEKVAAWGADAVIVQGGEGGGHTGPVPTTLLLPDVIGAVDVPVIAAGGFFDGRGLVAALAYGACGIAMGTRFLLTSDSPVPDAVKRECLSRGLRDTVVTTRVDGVPHRVLRTPLVDALDRADRARALLRSARSAARFRRLSGLTWPAMIRDGAAMRRGRGLSWAQVLMAASTPTLLRAAMVDGRADLGVMAAGQVAGLIDDLPSCADLIARIMAEAHEVLASLAALPR